MFIKQIKPLTLGSLSPRRLELLQRVGITPTVQGDASVVEVNEGADLQELALANAAAKFSAVAAKLSGGWLLTADTLVGLQGDVLGKPRDADEAKQMLQRLSGATHQVVTAYSLGEAGSDRPRLSRSVISEVQFYRLTPERIVAYVASGEPMDKAGAYGIQGEGAGFIRRVRGSPSNVMGLPMYEVVTDLVRFQLAVFAGTC